MKLHDCADMRAYAFIAKAGSESSLLQLYGPDVCTLLHSSAVTFPK